MTDKSKSEICQLSYEVEKSKKTHVQAGIVKEIDGQSYQVIDTEDNQHTGFQALAVAPIVDGKPDYNQVTVAYAGTNFQDDHDRDTDFWDVEQGRDFIGNSKEAIDRQIDAMNPYRQYGYESSRPSFFGRMQERDKKYGNVFTDHATEVT